MWNATASRKSTTSTVWPCASRRRRSSRATPSWPAPMDAETMRIFRRTGLDCTPLPHPRAGTHGRADGRESPLWRGRGQNRTVQPFLVSFVGGAR